MNYEEDDNNSSSAIINDDDDEQIFDVKREEGREEEEEGESVNMALTTRMSRTVVNASQRVFSYFQKGSSVVFRWFWVGGIIFGVVGLPLIRTMDKQIQFDELLAKFSYKVRELSTSSNKSRFKHI